MNLPAARELARHGRLYPSIILHGGNLESRLAAADELARTLLCTAPEEARPCGECSHCRRIAHQAPEGEEAPFHPDFRVLERDLKTATSVEATKGLLRLCRQAPFEARGQVFVVAQAETLAAEAANALLKVLEEPPERAPRHFLLATPAREDLLPTLRSRSWSIYLGAPEALPEAEVSAVAERFAAALAGLDGPGAPLALLLAAEALESVGGWEDLRASRPWSLTAAAVVRVARAATTGRRPLLQLAEALLEAPRWRLRSVPAQRILEGVVARHLGGGS